MSATSMSALAASKAKVRNKNAHISNVSAMLATISRPDQVVAEI
jgi:hypothetical protein